MIKVRIFCADIVARVGVASIAGFESLLTLLPQRVVETIVFMERRVNTHHPIFNFHCFYPISKFIEFSVILLLDYFVLILECNNFIMHKHRGLFFILIHHTLYIFLHFNILPPLLYRECVNRLLTCEIAER